MNFEYKMIKKTSGSVTFELSDKTAEFFVKHWFNKVVGRQNTNIDCYEFYKKKWEAGHYKDGSKYSGAGGFLNLLSDVASTLIGSNVQDPLGLFRGGGSGRISTISDNLYNLTELWSFNASPNGEPPRQLMNELHNYCRNELGLNINSFPHVGNAKGEWWRQTRWDGFDESIQKLYFEKKYNEMFNYFFDPKCIIKYLKFPRR